MNLPVQGLQQVLNFPNCARLITDNQLTSWPDYSINLCHHRFNFAPSKVEYSTASKKDDQHEGDHRIGGKC
ncbi:hypothetical protein Vadar_016400 [Vaccinium darrowii]|uniref:Uncharacterized protein n=1 Tax=Vaccinium darrowii TaxID=229202 RepID=A0ACB7YE40_9ERIC|nr:hypothetical protein Vadar_016400 [Vaccinium darrowii]